MDWDIYLKIVGGVVTVLTLLFTFYKWQREQWKEELKDTKSLGEESDWQSVVSDRSWRDQYTTGIDKALGWLDRFYGKDLLGGQAFARSFAIALIYPLLLFQITWAFGGSGSISELEMLPGD